MQPFVALGVQGAQTETSFGRGLSRYVVDQAAALVRHVPGVVAQVSYDPRLPLPPALAGLRDEVELATSARPPSGARAAVYHVMSPFEFLELDRLWPAWAQAGGVALVVTLHDLIPLQHPDRYLNERHARRWYLPRLELVRSADAVVAISESSAKEAVELLGIERDRIFVSYEDCGPAFAPEPGGSEAAAERCRSAIPALRPGFVLYVGGMDYRKNVVVLLDAYARLAPAERAAHQLVIAGAHLPHERDQLRDAIAGLGLTANVLLTGYVDDSVLADLYRACAVFVMPSLHEGFGLPVLEAMRCGAAVLASDAGALPELVTWPEARFDPADAGALRLRLEDVLGNAGLRQELSRHGLEAAGRFSWRRSAEVVADAYRQAASRRRSG